MTIQEIIQENQPVEFKKLEKMQRAKELRDIEQLMKHDSHKRVHGRMRQR